MLQLPLNRAISCRSLHFSPLLMSFFCDDHFYRESVEVLNCMDSATRYSAAYSLKTASKMNLYVALGPAGFLISCCLTLSMETLYLTMDHLRIFLKQKNIRFRLNSLHRHNRNTLVQIDSISKRFRLLERQSYSAIWSTG